MSKRFVSLFSGAGGLDQGFMDAGWEPVMMVDNWEPTEKTLRRNHAQYADRIYAWDMAALSYPMCDAALAQAGCPAEEVFCVAGGPPCLPKGELVISIDGPRKIEEIKRGDRVLTVSGKYRTVLNTGFKPFSGVLYGIRPQGCLQAVWFTGNHPIYVKRKTRRGFISAGMIEKRDRIGFPIVRAENSTALDFLRGSSFVKFHAEHSLWFLFGAYAGDGYLVGGPDKQGKKRYEIAFCPGPLEGEAAKSICAALTALGLHHYKDLSGGDTNIKIKTHNKDFWILCNRFGRLAPYKRIPEKLLSLEDALLHSLIEGLCVTDGHDRDAYVVRFRGRLQKLSATRKIASTSAPMLEWVQRALLRFGLLAGLRQTHEEGTAVIEGRLVNTHKCYALTWITQPKKRYYEIENGRMLWVPVKEVQTKRSTVDVYNLEVSGDHTFCGHLIGTHNCQPFSRLNQTQLFADGQTPTDQNLNDPRRSLFMDFLRIVEHISPRFVVMENVADLRTRKMGGNGPDRNRPIIEIIREEFDSAGYAVADGVLNARDYNVPQMRRRMIFIGARKDLGIAPQLPTPTPLATSVRAEFGRIRPEHPNQARKRPSDGWLERVRHIPPGGYYNDLPLEHKVLKAVDLDYVSAYDGQVRHYCFRRADGSWDEFRTTKGADKIARFLGRHEGWELSMSQLESDAEGCRIFRVMPRMGTYLRRIRWDVSHTVTRNPLIHPAEDRELTVREKASIQTFPPEYEFCGSAQEQHVLVGNAVPCNLGRAIAKHLERME